MEYKPFRGPIMQKMVVLLSILTIFHVQTAFSQLYNGQTLSEANLSDIISQVRPGTIVLLGENHGNATHQSQHLQVLEALRQSGHKVSVGLEFINYTDQNLLSQYRSGTLEESAFLSAIRWGGFGFEFYRPQLLFPQIENGEQSLGLNIPRQITSKISRQGFASLTPEELRLMPPDFALGRDSYRKRFMDAAGHHCKNPENCFIAQCTWDDTMAWRAVEFVRQNPEQVLVIVVGEFHVQYGGGIKHRLLERAPGTNVVTLSQIWAEDMSDDDVRTELRPSDIEGARADYIWVSRPQQ